MLSTVQTHGNVFIVEETLTTDLCALLSLNHTHR